MRISSLLFFYLLAVTAVQNASALSHPAQASLNKIVSGRAHNCALWSDGSIYCWGDNASGQLGIGREHKGFAKPAEVLSVSSYKDVAVGDDHSCAVTTKSTVECWGAGANGQNGALGDLEIPTTVSGLSQIEAIAAGAHHTCAIDQDMVAYCWGAGGFGQLGHGSTVESSAAPVEVDFDERIASIAAGGDHTCFLDLAGMLFCFGRGDFGQLGNGSAVSSAKPVPVDATENQLYSQVAAGLGFTCALEMDGAIWCFGKGDSGQLGTGENVDTLEPHRVASPYEFVHVSLGTDHACATAKDGQAYCWGSNRHSKLGSEDEMTQAMEPVQVTTTAKFAGASAGADHTCFSSTDSGLYCHGHGAGGRLGSGAAEDIKLPKRIRSYRDSVATGVLRRCSSREIEEGQIDVFGMIMAIRGKKDCLAFAKDADAITELDLSASKIVDTTDIGYFRKLTKLNLRKNEIKELRGFQPLKILRELDVSQNKLKKIKQLRWVRTLKKLTVAHNDLKDLNGIGKSRGLEYIDAGHNNLMNLNSLAITKKVTYLDLSQNNFTDIGGLVKLKLDTLIMSGNDFNQIENPHFLDSLVVKTKFIARGCRINNLSFLAKNKMDLKIINLDNNRIWNLTPLKNHKHIEVLSLVRSSVEKKQETCPRDAKSQPVRDFCAAL